MDLGIEGLLRWLDGGRFPKEEFPFTREDGVAVGLFLAGLLVTAACVIAGVAVATT